MRTEGADETESPRPPYLTLLTSPHNTGRAAARASRPTECARSRWIGWGNVTDVRVTGTGEVRRRGRQDEAEEDRSTHSLRQKQATQQLMSSTFFLSFFLSFLCSAFMARGSWAVVVHGHGPEAPPLSCGPVNPFPRHPRRGARRDSTRPQRTPSPLAPYILLSQSIGPYSSHSSSFSIPPLKHIAHTCQDEDADALFHSIDDSSFVHPLHTRGYFTGPLLPFRSTSDARRKGGGGRGVMKVVGVDDKMMLMKVACEVKTPRARSNEEGPSQRRCGV